MPLISDKEAYDSEMRVQLKNIPTYITLKRQLFKFRGAKNIIQYTCEWDCLLRNIFSGKEPININYRMI